MTFQMAKDYGEEVHETEMTSGTLMCFRDVSVGEGQGRGRA